MVETIMCVRIEVEEVPDLFYRSSNNPTVSHYHLSVPALLVRCQMIAQQPDPFLTVGQSASFRLPWRVNKC